MRKSKDISILTIYFLNIFLPFYAITRAFFQFENIDILSLFINYVRDAVILTCLLICILKQNLRNSDRYKFSNESKITKNVKIGILLLFVNYSYGFFVSIISGYFDLAIKGVHLNVVPIFLVYIIYSSNYIKVEAIRSFIRMSINIGMVVSIIGLYFYVIKPDIFGSLLLIFSQQESSKYLQVLNYSRMVGTFLSPNVFGSYMAISLLITINEIINTRKNRLLFLNITATVTFLTCLILSLSRGAWAFAVVGIFILIISNKTKLNISKIKLLISIITVIMIAGLIISLLDGEVADYSFYRLISLFDGSSSAYGRVDNWAQAIDSLSSNIFGFGLGVGGINLAYNTELAQSLGVNVVDGYYVKLVVETGIVGMFLFSMFLFLEIHSLLKAIKKYKSKNRDIYVLTLAIFGGFLAQSFGSNPLDYVNIAPFLWIYLGFSMKLLLTAEDKSENMEVNTSN